MELFLFILYALSIIVSLLVVCWWSSRSDDENRSNDLPTRDGKQYGTPWNSPVFTSKPDFSIDALLKDIRDEWNKPIDNTTIYYDLLNLARIITISNEG
jgi:hypothetical protein